MQYTEKRPEPERQNSTSKQTVQITRPRPTRPCHRTDGYPLDVIALALSRGISVHIKPLPDKIAGILHKFPGKSYLYLNASHNPMRQRFTVAHEVAHHILDPAGTYLAHTDTATTVCERRANKYAAEILMPEGEVLRCTDRNMSIADMLSYFGVSEEAMKIRLEEVEGGAAKK